MLVILIPEERPVSSDDLPLAQALGLNRRRRLRIALLGENPANTISCLTAKTAAEVGKYVIAVFI